MKSYQATLKRIVCRVILIRDSLVRPAYLRRIRHIQNPRH